MLLNVILVLTLYLRLYENCMISYKKVVNPQSGQPGGNAGPTNTSNFNAATGFQSAEKSTLRGGFIFL